MKHKIARLSALTRHALLVGSIGLIATVNKGSSVSADPVGFGAIAQSLFSTWISTTLLLLVFVFIASRIIFRHFVQHQSITTEVVALILVSCVGLYGMTISSSVLTAMPPFLL